MTVEKSPKGICFIKVIQKRTITLPATVCRQLNKNLEIITNSILELYVKVIYVEKKSEALVTTAQNMHNTVMTMKVSREVQLRKNKPKKLQPIHRHKDRNIKSHQP